jgi:hypothetical protein
VKYSKSQSNQLYSSEREAISFGLMLMESCLRKEALAELWFLFYIASEGPYNVEQIV